MKNYLKIGLLLIGMIAISIAFVPIESSLNFENNKEVVIQTQDVMQSQDVIIYEAGIFGGETDGDSIAVWIFGILTTIFGSAFAVVKKKFTKITAFVKSLYESIQTINDAMKDDALSKSEVQEIKKSLKIVIDSFKDIFKKDEK